MIQHITHNDKLISIIIRRDFEKDGIEFITPADFSQQVAYMKRPKGYVITAHLHKAVLREVRFTKEVLFIKSGRVRIDLYDDDKNYLESTILETGDVVLLASGGHGFEMIEESEIIEVKQGPYAGDMDKVRFEPVTKEKVEIK